MDFLPKVGAVGLAVSLTALLWFGTSTGGKAKALGWWWTLFLAMVAGAAYNAAGTPFDLLSGAIQDGIDMLGGMIEGLTVAGIALTLGVVILYKKLTTRQVAICGIVFWYVSSGAGGAFTIIAEKIGQIMQNLAS